MASTITIYNSNTGIILRNVSGLGDITNNVKSGESYIEGIYLTDTHTIVDGAAVAKSSAVITQQNKTQAQIDFCLLYTSPSPRDATLSRMPSSA